MSYTKTVWKDRSVEKPSTYTITNNGDGTSTLAPAPGAITEAGTPITASVMNNIEDGISSLDKRQSVVTVNDPAVTVPGMIIFRTI